MDWFPLWISLKVSVIATCVSFVVALAVARRVIGMSGISRTVVDGLCTLPMVLPPSVLGFLLLIIFGRSSPVGQLLARFGIRIIFTWWGAVIAAAVVAFPLMYRSARVALERIDSSIVNAARTLGLSEWRIFFTILIPLSWPGIAAGLALSFARALGEFGATLMVAGNIPGQTGTIPLAIYFASESGRLGEAGLWVAIILAVSFTAMAVMNWTEGRKR